MPVKTQFSNKKCPPYLKWLKFHKEQCLETLAYWNTVLRCILNTSRNCYISFEHILFALYEVNQISMCAVEIKADELKVMLIFRRFPGK